MSDYWEEPVDFYSPESEELKTGIFDSPLGKILIESLGGCIRRINFSVLSFHEDESDPAIDLAKVWLEEYFEGTEPNPWDIPPLAPEGSDFCLRVWRELSTIPYGKTTTYGELARRLFTSPRAIGQAVGWNPIDLILPCHRVIGADGSLTGFAYGVERKLWLLEHEGLQFSWSNAKFKPDGHLSPTTKARG